MTTVFIRKNQNYSNPIEFILRVFAKNKSCQLSFVNDKSGAQLIWDHDDPGTMPINLHFYGLLNKKVYNHESHFKNSPYILFPDSDLKDWLSTAFYMINSFQEYSAETSNDQFDNHGRFRYDMSYQFKFGCIEENLVQKCFDEFEKEHKVLETSPNQNKQSRVFLSHDIDTIHGSFLQDGLWAMKRGRVDVILKLVMNEILSKPGWKNIDKIVKLHSENDLKSTFFWLATEKIAENKVKNADYDIRKLKTLLELSKSNGLHKSSYNTSFEDELKMLPFETKLNRYHFLKFKLPEAYDIIQSSQIQFDASLGFADHYGFRNNYGLPFKPYNIQTGKSYGFVEVPLNVMDGTIDRYMKIPVEETATRIIDFFEKNKTNSIISLLWHNTYFTDYKYSGYLYEYKKVLLYFKESGIKSITPEEILYEFSSY